MMNNSQTLPLSGVSVTEFCQVAAGPFCGMLLSDFGATVTKVEPPEGDSLRQWPPISGSYSENFASLNRGKRSVVLNLKDSKDIEVARALVLNSDVLIENNRPGVMSRLGLGYEWFKGRKPSLIYCSISAYGQSGPRSAEGGFDLTIQAAAGVMSVTGETGGTPVKCGVPVSDFTAGLYGAFAISAKIAEVRNGGPGAHLDIPMFSTTLAIAALQTSEYFGTGRDPEKRGSAHPRNAPYEAFRASDGWFAIAAGNNKLWKAVCDVVGLRELAEAERFSSPTLRAKNQGELKLRLEQIFCLQPIAFWLSAFGSAGVPNAAINSYGEAIADPQTVHLDLVQDIQIPDFGASKTIASPIRINGQALALRAALPRLGEHTAECKQKFSKLLSTN